MFNIFLWLEQQWLFLYSDSPTLDRWVLIGFSSWEKCLQLFHTYIRNILSHGGLVVLVLNEFYPSTDVFMSHSKDQLKPLSVPTKCATSHVCAVGVLPLLQSLSIMKQFHLWQMADFTQIACGIFFKDVSYSLFSLSVFSKIITSRIHI